jgi:GT2 family glycosyltransferase
VTAVTKQGNLNGGESASFNILAMTASVRIAVLMTCHNRKAETLRTLAALFQQQGYSVEHLTVYLVDDGSLDGTATAVQDLYPQVIVLPGTGELFWNGGMRLAFEQAILQEYDFHLWLNDDTTLYPDAIVRLLTTFNQLVQSCDREGIVSGATQDAQTHRITSGGFCLMRPEFLMRFELIEPHSDAISCDTISGNCVLIPRSIVQALDNLKPYFSHFLGDLDYGLRARKLGHPIWIAPGYVGTSPQHHGRGNELYQAASLPQVYRQLRHPKGISFGDDLQQRFLPMGEWTLFLKKHSGRLWVIPWLLTYRKLLGLLLKRWLSRLTQSKNIPYAE